MADKPDYTAIYSEYDFVFVVDGSGSMSNTDTPNGKSRWNYVRETIGAFAREVGEVDSDGMGFVVFNQGQVTAQDGVDAKTIESVFTEKSPRGGTPLAEALRAALKLAGKSSKKDMVIVVTDGEPDDKRGVIDAITQAANNTPSDDALTILFIQVGHDTAATSFLKGLDDDIKAKHDIVDVKTVDEAERFGSIGELVAAAIAG